MSNRAGGGRPTDCRDSGFTILEIVVAVAVLFVVMVGMAHSATIALVDIGHSRQRQSATGLANQALEQVRALPFDAVLRGLSNDVLAAGSDPNVTSKDGTYWYDGEEIARHTPATADARPPLVPHSRDIKIGPTVYRVSTYVTFTAPGNALRVTAEVDWKGHALRQGASGKVQARSIFSPGVGCTGSTATHPYAAPCPTSFSAIAAVEPGGLTITPTAPDAFEQATLELPVQAVTVESGHIVIVDTSGRSSGISMKMTDADRQSLGGTVASARSEGSDLYVANSFGDASVNDTLTATSSTNPVWVRSGGTDSAKSVATVAAPGDPKDCRDGVGTDENDDHPCGSGKFTRGATLATGVVVDATSLTFATASPQESPTVLFGDRDFDTSDTACSIEGCMAARASRTMGSLDLGTATGTGPTADWAGYLVRLSGFQDSVSAEVGEGSAAPRAERAGTVSYWDAATGAYVPIDLAASVSGTGSATVAQQINTSATIEGTAYRVEMTAVLTIGGLVVEETLEDPCSPPMCRLAGRAVSESPLKGTVHMRVVALADSSVVADVVIGVELGTFRAEASYELATSAA